MLANKKFVILTAGILLTTQNTKPSHSTIYKYYANRFIARIVIIESNSNYMITGEICLKT